MTPLVMLYNIIIVFKVSMSPDLGICACMQNLPGQKQGLDAVRAARMGGFGFVFYGPYQHFWYKHLDRLFPTKSVPHFAWKVRLLLLEFAP